ncbi:MAG TPA: sulfite exporter TauE/SafE family protein, partial [Burkholderiaceae bacterium]
MWSTAPLPPLLLIASLLIVFGAGVVRGFAGFGFSALSVAGLALLVSPARVVPAIFMLEVLASLSLLRSAARDIDWHWLGW